MRNVFKWPEPVSCIPSGNRAEEEPLLLSLHELHWVAVSVRNQAACEEKVLRFLEETRGLADDPAWHDRQVECQRQILTGYQALAYKLACRDQVI